MYQVGWGSGKYQVSSSGVLGSYRICLRKPFHKALVYLRAKIPGKSM